MNNLKKDLQSINAIASDNKKQEISETTPEKKLKRRVVDTIWKVSHEKALEVAKILGVRID